MKLTPVRLLKLVAILLAAVNAIMIVLWVVPGLH